jgi:hypothetical protein
MADGLGLSVGATNLAAVVVGRTAVTRSPVVTLYPHRPTEVGVPSENPNLNERGLIITDFTERVGDPVGIVAADGSTHQADALLADALRAMLFAVGRGQPPATPVGVTYPAHWRPPAVEALRGALAGIPEFSRPTPAPLVSDATAALTALQNDPGLPTRGAVALCDFGGTGTSITVADAATGFQPIGPTVRHADLSGDLVDQALLTHVINDLSAAGTIDLSSTSAIGSLTRLRGQCRGAKERLSTAAVTSLVADLPGHRSDVRLTRNELDEAIRQPLADFIVVLQETLDRSGIRASDLVAVASAGGVARIPIITTTLSEHFRVPVVTTPQPELTAAIGGGLSAVRGTAPEGMTAMAAAAPAVAAAAAAAEMGPASRPDEAASSTFRALAWSDADDVPDVVPTDPYDYAGPADVGGVRPRMQFEHEPYQEQAPTLPWYRNPGVVVGAGFVVLLAALAAAVLFVMRDNSTPAPASTTTATTTQTTTAAAPPPAEPAPPQTQAPPQTRTVTRQAPPRVTQTQAPPATQTQAPPPPTSEAPPPAPATTEAPPATTQPPPWSPTAPYPTIPGLPWVPAPHLPQPAQPAP